MNSETLYLFCLKFFETLHPNFCIDKNELDKNELDKNDELSEDPDDNELLIDNPPSIHEIIRDEVNQENISMTAYVEPEENTFIESISNKSDNEAIKEPNYFCNCVKKLALFLTSKIKKSD
jgi:hypothetical protein